MTREARSVQRKSTNLSLDARLVAEAKNLDINISRVAEKSIADAVAEEKARLWKIENREVIEAWNEYVERNGLPLAKYRQF
ncbi:type II toxin-antitoxin system CcdA family antitoxin [Allomesorhizobium camelthorni]|jgi:antitoxin CcdA|uniref:Type II toxin-antitoxin system CcdA family antitoxin n=1 Tax=Allomesorhizobium camelthorni TaxID=475069 RepID=A0A6G4W4Z6_9HYPH|nr:type II toxin-antitoxin system CcdA family antitoxin [Mesorhizobium camelthorni]NGO49821.1 type II toxin-antitoxin system CcdA family antitoxin [Mesorhizobium camelthorni]